MSILVATNGDGPHLAPSEQFHVSTSSLSAESSTEDELDAMVKDLISIDIDLPIEVLRLCQSFMARCTEIHLSLVRIEGRDRGAKFVRTQQLAKVMALIDFSYKAASRAVEVRRQDVELSK